MWRIGSVAVLYLSDYALAFFGMPVLGHTWSLSVEEHFYMLWPFAILALIPFSVQNRSWLLIAAFAATTLWRLVNGWYFPELPMSLFRLDTRLSGLILGAWLAVARPQIETASANRIALISLAGIALMVWRNPGLTPVQAAYFQLGVDIATFGLIASLTVPSSFMAWPLSWRPVTYIGLISYSIYLWQQPIALALDIYNADWRITFAATFTLSVAIAALSYWLIEKPLRIWRSTRYAGSPLSAR
jgi:peptidoglycan/LPS O-acetylase OafA/YrhL